MGTKKKEPGKIGRYNQLRLTARLWGGSDRVVLSPTWISSGAWAILRAHVVDADLLNITEGPAQCRLFEHVLRLARFSVKEVLNTTKDEPIVRPWLGAGAGKKPLKKFTRTRMTVAHDKTDGVLFRAADGEFVEVDRRHVEGFRLFELWGRGGLCLLANSDDIAAVSVLVGPVDATESEAETAGVDLSTYEVPHD